MFYVTVSFIDAKGLSNPSEVEALREKVYASLEAYTKHNYPDQPGRQFPHCHLDILLMKQHFCSSLFLRQTLALYQCKQIEYVGHAGTVVESKCFFSFQVCQAAPPSARSALHRTEVPGAPVFLQTHRRHTYRHFPHGDAGSTASNHMTKVLLHVNTPQCTLNPIITKRSSYFLPSTM